ncbi:P-loop containing nucleoside triphosphate hydrolase protein [Chlamydoabsidia padenii]|nr:P-loop containing nucleoside triphosphate hydrolase protein [Chlamydoabsidia padenii]
MSLTDLILSETLRKKVEEAGYASLDELKKISIIQLAQDIDLTEEEVSFIVPLIHDKNSSSIGTSAFNLAQDQRHGITTSCQLVDELLAPTNGIPKGGITELCGGPGSGKTQFCIQLALNVQLPPEEGGLDGECIYIDTVGGLVMERFYQMAQTNKDKSDGDQIQLKLGKITHFRVLELVEMIALIRQLPTILQELPKVKLLIVDSIAYHLRLNIRENRVRVGMVNFIGQSLVQVANQFNLAIVVTNCVSMDRMFNLWRPSLGESWAQWCTHRLMLTRKRQQRYAMIYNAPHQTSKTMAPFSITRTGIEDVDKGTLERMYQWQDAERTTDHDPSLTAGCDNQDIWDEQAGLTDELLSEIPSNISIDESMIEEEERRYTLVPDSQPDDYPYTDHLLHYEEEDIQDEAIHPSEDPPSTYSNRRHHRPDSPSIDTMNKRPRLQDDHHQSGDDWGSDNDELWLSIAGMSSPSF